MKRLIQRGLMFGNLFHVSSPALVERYNRALKHLTGKTTKLTDFHIDISGFAPEIGDELDDPLYLNHAGVNRQFILLSTEQKRSPLLNAKFSTSHTILRKFFDDNEAQLFALTARDAVAGELVNSVYAVTNPPTPVRHSRRDGRGGHDHGHRPIRERAGQKGRYVFAERGRMVRRSADRRNDHVGE